jgi:CheY-like chemotaxis protein
MDSPHPKPQCVLIVDDDPQIRTLFRLVLEGEGYTVKDAEHGLAALELMNREQVDVFVVDLSMPEMDGFETIRQVRSHWPSTKIIAVSGFMAGMFLPVAKYMDADATLSKPVEPEDLLKAVSKVVAQ